MATATRLRPRRTARGLLLALGLLGLAWAAWAQEAAEDEWTLLDQRMGEGEQCLVCGKGIHGQEIVEVRYKGRTFHVAASMLEEFDQTPETYFYRLQAHSGLFDETGVAARPLARGWLLLGGYVLLALVSAAFCGYLAIGRGLAPIPWFFAGLAGNVAALVLLLFVPRGEAAALPAGLSKARLTAAPVPCPGCAAPNHPAAPVCTACGATLQPTAEAETARV